MRARDSIKISSRCHKSDRDDHSIDTRYILINSPSASRHPHPRLGASTVAVGGIDRCCYFLETWG